MRRLKKKKRNVINHNLAIYILIQSFNSNSGLFEFPAIGDLVFAQHNRAGKANKNMRQFRVAQEI